MKKRDWRRHPWGYATILLIALLTAGCGGRSEVVVDEVVHLSDGHSLAYTILKGKYQVEFKATGAPVNVEWTPANCLPSEAAMSGTAICQLHQDGRITVGNPAAFGLGDAADVAVKVTRLGN